MGIIKNLFFSFEIVVFVFCALRIEKEAPRNCASDKHEKKKKKRNENKMKRNNCNFIRDYAIMSV